MTQPRPLALFDLDGTLTRRDTLSDLLYHQFGLGRCLRAGISLAPPLLGVPLGVVHRDRAKVDLLRHFFAGMTDEAFRALGRDYALNHLDRLLRPQARQRLDWHRQAGHRVIVISASVREWIQPWTDSLGIELLATELERRNGRLTGELDGPNCRGAEKVVRLQSLLDPADYHPIHAYGDTDGDTEMLALADHAVYRGLR
ncbi:HAD family hydrolase [Gammaproteobacteria bacterium 2W06]|nr:HAD family hydrolase [Gammaproteobacteria bacterium 2W06]